MNNLVLEMLVRGRAAPFHVSPVDAVMGDDWAVVDFGRSGPARQMMRQSLMEAHRQDIAPSGSPMSSTVPGYSAQAVVKMVRTGGAKNAAGLKAQMDYLARDGDVKMHRSERFMGIEIDAEEMDNMVAGWNMPTDGRGKADRTSHFIVSFPRETGVAAAERAGRAWAEEMFGSGNYGGDTFDYYTAFHTDRDHPHTHVIVHRRGLDNGTWLKVSRRSDFNYQAMRDVAVQMGHAEGIVLEATPRLARGAWSRPISDAEYRRAQAEGRAPQAPEHTPVTAARSAAAIIYYARRFAAEAKLLEGQAPELAELLRDTARAIETGKEVTETFHKTTVDAKEIATMNERVAAARAETQEKFREMDEGLEKLDDDATRTRFMRQVAALKGEAAPYMDQPELADYQRPAEKGRYEGMVPRNARETEIKEDADKQVREIAAQYGVNPDATVERYSGGAPSKALADQYGEAEARERERHRSQHGDREETAAQRDKELARMHSEIRSIYLNANDQAVEVRREDVAGTLNTMREEYRAGNWRGFKSAAETEAFARDVDFAYGDGAWDQLRGGDTTPIIQDFRSQGQRFEVVSAVQIAAVNAQRENAAGADKPETPREEQQRRDQERRNAERKARERDGGRGL